MFYDSEQGYATAIWSGLVANRKAERIVIGFCLTMVGAILALLAKGAFFPQFSVFKGMFLTVAIPLSFLACWILGEALFAKVESPSAIPEDKSMRLEGTYQTIGYVTAFAAVWLLLSLLESFWRAVLSD